MRVREEGRWWRHRRDWSDDDESDEQVTKEKRGNQHSPDDLFMIAGVELNY